ncbi:hypothetical protein GCM10022380_08240 [Amycolatopsis tucumanensis]|uniref:Secreted protein n=1 Tax=Amycolatopsis tucumanensis TaxID=401106 RepID=A0ABP7HLS3_9PSEU
MVVPAQLAIATRASVVLGTCVGWSLTALISFDEVVVVHHDNGVLPKRDQQWRPGRLENRRTCGLAATLGATLGHEPCLTH